MVASGVAQRFDLFILTCLRIVFRHNTHNRQTSMPPVGFEPTISAGERPKTYALDRAATISGSNAGYAKFRCSKGYWLPTTFASFLFTFPPVRHRVASRFNWTLIICNSAWKHENSSKAVEYYKKENRRWGGKNKTFLFRTCLQRCLWYGTSNTRMQL